MAEDLTAWIGNEERVDDLITAWPIAALRATLDLADRTVPEGTEVDPLWHWLFFLPTTPRSDIGHDGHARLGGFLPPVSLPRRMYAGGRFEFLKPLSVGDRATRRSVVSDVVEKQGRSGRLVFVTVRHEIATEAGTTIIEEQDLVYREVERHAGRPAQGGEPPPPAAWRTTVVPDEVLLFRFSALTFNGHRIHYDHPFTTETEAYPGLIVHGPLTALLLAGLAAEEAGRRLRRFSFRGTAPLFCGEPITLVGNPEGDEATLEAWSVDNRLAMTARAGYA